MVSSNKKKRGQQRKAAKANKEQELVTFMTRGIRKAGKTATIGLVHPDCRLSTNEDLRGTKVNIIIEVLPVVLNFLKRCEHETFHQVVANVGGDLQTPDTWIEVLFNGAKHVPSCRMQITESISPLVSCMCNDTERLFFKSNKHWNESIASFVQLISTIACHSIHDKEEILTDTLFKYDGLLTSIVQWAFWGMGDRPDIARDLQSEEISHIRLLGSKTTEIIVCSDNYVRDEAGLLTEKGKSVLDIVATTPFVSKGFDPTCMVSFVAGYIRQLKNDRRKSQDDFLILKRLIGEANSVDKGVVSELIDYGLRYALDHESACFVADISHDMLYRVIKDSEQQHLTVCASTGAGQIIALSSDTRIAFAIRSGIVEMCLSFIGSGGSVSNVLHQYIGYIFRNIHKIVLHQKTAKAVRSKKTVIEEQLIRIQQNTIITSNAGCIRLLDMVRSILNLNGSYCCRCNKSLSRTEVLQCNGCGCMSYCSKACQKEDWLNGHSVTCCRSFTNETAGQFQGMILPPGTRTPDNEQDARKMEELEKNITMIQLKLFLDNSETILQQAEALDLLLYDCVVWFDLCECPQKVTTKIYTDSFTEAEERKGFEESRSKQNITCFYISKFNRNASPFFSQRLFPHEWLTSKRV